MVKFPGVMTLVSNVPTASPSVASSTDPVAEVVAVVILITGVVPPEETIGAVPVTAVTSAFSNATIACLTLSAENIRSVEAVPASASA